MDFIDFDPPKNEISNYIGSKIAMSICCSPDWELVISQVVKASDTTEHPEPGCFKWHI